jgi:hypothetical protein
MMSPQFVMNPDDLGKALGAIKNLRDPAGLLYRMVGIGQTERQAGVPGWAWVAVALGTGIYLGAAYAPVVREKLGFALKGA